MSVSAIDCLKNIQSLSSLNTKELNYIVANGIKELYDKNTVVIIEGALADSFYIIISGSAEVYTSNNLGAEIVLKRLGQGNNFGGWGYYNRFIRSANIRTTSKTELFKISYALIAEVFKTKNKKKNSKENISDKNLPVSFISNNSSEISAYLKDIFASHLDKNYQAIQNSDSSNNIIRTKFIPLKKLSSLYHKFTWWYKLRNNAEIKLFKKNDVIFNKGDKSDFVYFILSGLVDLCFENKTRDVILKNGNLFGENGVLNHEDRDFTAKALSATKLMAIEEDQFLKALEKNPELKSLIISLKKSYKIAKNKITISQFTGNFRGQEAIFTTYHLKNNETAIAIKLLKLPIFKMSLGSIVPDRILEFKKGDLIRRSIAIKDNQIISIDLLGDW